MKANVMIIMETTDVEIAMITEVVKTVIEPLTPRKAFGKVYSRKND